MPTMKPVDADPGSILRALIADFWKVVNGAEQLSKKNVQFVRLIFQRASLTVNTEGKSKSRD